MPQRTPDPTDLRSRLGQPLIVDVADVHIDIPDDHYHLASGVYPAVCVDVIWTGIRWTPFGDKPTVAYVWQVQDRHPETGHRMRAWRRFNRSLNAKAHLRLFLEKWQGGPFLPSELKEGIDLERHGLDRNAHLVVEQVQSEGWARPLTVVRWALPRAPDAPFLLAEDYVRTKYRKMRPRNDAISR